MSHLSLVQVSEYVDAEIMLEDDELPPPIPNEAKMSWLSSMLQIKGEMDITPIVTVEPKQVEESNVWSKLPQNSIDAVKAHNRPTRAFQGLAYAPTYKFMAARFSSKCHSCKDRMEAGDLICYDRSIKRAYCEDCDEFRANNVERMMNGLNCARADFNAGTL